MLGDERHKASPRRNGVDRLGERHPNHGTKRVAGTASPACRLKLGDESRRRAKLRDATTNPKHYVDYQDCKYLGRPVRFEHPAMLCGGIAGLHHVGPAGDMVNYDLGGVAIVDTVSMRPFNELPFQEYTDQRQVATRNAIDVQIVNGRLRLYLIADDDDSDLLVYEAR